MVRIREHVALKDYSSYKIGGPARYFCEPKNVEEIRGAVEWARQSGVPIFVLGGGTNLLIDDAGFPGLVIKPSLLFLETRSFAVHVGAGVLVSDLLAFCVKNSLSGLEWAGGLPGTVGGAVRGNAGCFGRETKDVTFAVEGFDAETGEVTKRNREECRFAYRSSIFKERSGKEVVLAASFLLQEGEREKIRSAIEEKIDYRRAHHPLEYPNIGSIFKNIDLRRIPGKERGKFAVVKNDPFPVVPTAYVISETGLKGLREGDAMVSPKHPNFIVNMGNARASDVKILITRVKEAVRERFSVELEEEVQIVP